MSTSISNPKEFWSGVMFLTLGVGGMVIAQDYRMGDAGRMGPGYFPSVLSGMLILVGLVSLVRSFLSHGEPIGKLAIKQAAFVLFGMFLFGFLIREVGLIAAIVLLVVVSARASTRFRWRSAILLAAGSAAFCIGVFILGLGLPLPVLGPWFGS